MSSLYGVPPPPRPAVLEPPPGQVPVRATTLERTPEVEPWKRRLAITLAFFAVTSLLLANLCTWAHFHLLAPKPAASTFASATLVDAQSQATALLEPAVAARVRAAVATADRTGLPTPGTDETTVGTRVAAAVDSAVRSSAFTTQWESAVAQAAQDERAVLDGTSTAPGTTGGTTVTVALDPLMASIRKDLVQSGYAFMARTALPPPTFVVTTTESAAYVRAPLRAADSLWWFLALAAAGLAAGAVYLAARRVRMAMVIAIDSVFVLAVCLLLVAAGAQVAGGQAGTPAQQTLIEDGYRAVTHSLVPQTLLLMAVAACTAVALWVYGRRPAPRPAPDDAA